MTKGMKFIAAVGLVACVFMCGTQSHAAITIPVQGGTYEYSTTLVTEDPAHFPGKYPWAYGDGKIIQNDKIFTYIDSTSNLNLSPVKFIIMNAGGVDYHSIKLADNVGNFTLTPGTYVLEYTIEVAAEFPLVVIKDASLAVDGRTKQGNVSLVTVTKDFYTDITHQTKLAPSLVSVGGTGDYVLFPGGVRFVDVVETIVVSDGGWVNSTTDTYSQTIVPEPATLAIWSLLGACGWLGMRVARRRRLPTGRQPWSPENRRAIHELIARGTQRN